MTFQHHLAKRITLHSKKSKEKDINYWSVIIKTVSLQRQYSISSTAGNLAKPAGVFNASAKTFIHFL